MECVPPRPHRQRGSPSVRETTRIPLGSYRGLRFGIVLQSQFPPDVYLEGETTRQTMLSKEHQGPRAVLNALERLAGGYGSDCDRVRQDLAIAEAQLRDYQARLGKPFTHDGYLAELTALRDQLKAGLSASSQMQADEGKPTVSELAEQIKSLKTSHSTEDAPQRARQKHSSAEEPVTARIRRRTEAILPSNQAMGSDAVSPAGTPADHAGTTQDSSHKPQMSFQEWVARSRQREEGSAPTR